MDNITEFLDKYIDEKNNIDNKLSLNSNGINALTYDIENLVDKYTGVEGSSFMKCSEIRLHIMELIHQIVCSLHPLPPLNKKEKTND